VPEFANQDPAIRATTNTRFSVEETTNRCSASVGMSLSRQDVRPARHGSAPVETEKVSDQHVPS
jgi:hypothetical protein